MKARYEVQVYLNGWKYEDEVMTQEAAIEVADDNHDAYSHCYRVIDTKDEERELYRTDGASEYDDH